MCFPHVDARRGNDGVHFVEQSDTHITENTKTTSKWFNFCAIIINKLLVPTVQCVSAVEHVSTMEPADTRHAENLETSGRCLNMGDN